MTHRPLFIELIFMYNLCFNKKIYAHTWAVKIRGWLVFDGRFEVTSMRRWYKEPICPCLPFLSWGGTTMHTAAGMQKPQKWTRNPPMSNVQSHREKLQFGQTYHLREYFVNIFFFRQKYRILRQKCENEYSFSWSSTGRHQRSLLPLSANRSKHKIKQFQLNVITKGDDGPNIKSVKIVKIWSIKARMLICRRSPVVYCIFGNSRPPCNMRPRPYSN